MIESIGSRPTASSGPATAVPTGQPDELVVYRPTKKVLPAERVNPNAPTGPRPAFQHTYLELISALWPREPEAPATHVDYDAPEAEDRPNQSEPEATSAEKTAAKFVRDQPAPGPVVDILR